MRHYDIPYVKNGPVNYYPAVPLQEMSLEEIKKKYIKTCAKANGNVSECSKCKTPCQEGKRAIQLIANSVYSDPPVPLYGGKTLIERAKEENMKRREEAAKAETEETEKKKSRKSYTKLDNWWEDSLASGDQVKWLIDKMGISKTQAKKKIYQYKWTHGMTGSAMVAKDTDTNDTAPVVNTTIKAFEESLETPKQKGADVENKLESLMKLQEEHKKAMAEYQRLYEQTKAEYEKIKQKTDILCSALDIINEL